MRKKNRTQRCTLLCDKPTTIEGLGREMRLSCHAVSGTRQLDVERCRALYISGHFRRVIIQTSLQPWLP